MKIVRTPPLGKALHVGLKVCECAIDGLRVEENTGVLERICNDREQEALFLGTRTNAAAIRRGHLASVGGEYALVGT